LLVPRLAIADEEMEQLRRQLEDVQERIQQLEGAADLPAVSATEETATAAEAGDGGYTSQDQSGNDPREFSTKFMPYYRFTHLENGVQTNELTLFGFLAFTGRFGMTYEVPIAKEIDYGDDAVGLGDSIWRFFLRPQSLEVTFGGVVPLGVDLL
jgi:hypothetical protein